MVPRYRGKPDEHAKTTVIRFRTAWSVEHASIVTSITNRSFKQAYFPATKRAGQCRNLQNLKLLQKIAAGFFVLFLTAVCDCHHTLSPAAHRIITFCAVEMPGVSRLRVGGSRAKRTCFHCG